MEQDSTHNSTEETTHGGAYPPADQASEKTAVRNLRRLFPSAEFDAMTPAQMYAAAQRDPKKAADRAWITYRITQLRYHDLLESLYRNNSRGKEVAKYQVTAKGKKALASNGKELISEEASSEEASSEEERQRNAPGQEASEEQTSPVEAPETLDNEGFTLDQEAFTLDSIVLFVIEWQKAYPFFEVALKISLEGLSIFDIVLKGKEQEQGKGEEQGKGAEVG